MQPNSINTETGSTAVTEPSPAESPLQSATSSVPPTAPTAFSNKRRRRPRLGVTLLLIAVPLVAPVLIWIVIALTAPTIAIGLLAQAFAGPTSAQAHAPSTGSTVLDAVFGFLGIAQVLLVVLVPVAICVGVVRLKRRLVNR
jgi:hypothetical protein